jgi:flavin reductase (DIM6/NTAB) family NADH-FMN oxidoreductase RutF
MLSFDPKEIPTKDLHQFLLGSVAPRPIAFASTIDKDGNPNIAPYSFFNAFSSNPPILVFSSNRRVEDNTTKDTLHNIQETGEVVINVVNYNIVRQMAVTSVSFPAGVSEFEKAGLTPIPSDLVKPFRVKESPAHMECKVRDIITLGEEGGAGHLIICDVVRMHISKDVIDERNRIDPHKMDLMGRMGRAYYVRASGDAVKTIVQPVMPLTIGYNQLPESIRNSSILTANNLGQLAGMPALPNEEAIAVFKNENVEIQAILESGDPKVRLHEFAKRVLDNTDDRDTAIKALLIADGL